MKEHWMLIDYSNYYKKEINLIGREFHNFPMKRKIKNKQNDVKKNLNYN
jgi:hypothetical protein